jgi:hypothetical protein
VDGLLVALERSGGYAALVGLTLVGVFWLARHQISEQTKQSRERESSELARHTAELSRISEYVQREGLSAAEHREDKRQLIAVVKANTESMTALAEVVRTSIEMQRQTNERLIALDKYLSVRAEELRKLLAIGKED